jgi:hypothetical protein
VGTVDPEELDAARIIPHEEPELGQLVERLPHSADGANARQQPGLVPRNR